MYFDYDLDAFMREPLFYRTDIFIGFSLYFVNFCIAGHLDWHRPSYN